MSSNNEIRINDIRFPCTLLCRPAVAIAPWSPTDVIVVFVLSLPLSMADFTPGKQTLLRQAISRAAAVPLSKVLVNKFQPVARRRFQVGIPHTPHTGGLMSSLESGVGRRLLADYIKVDVKMAAADTNDAQAAIVKLTPKRISQELLNAGLPAAQVLVSAQVFYTLPSSTPPPQGILLDSHTMYTMHLTPPSPHLCPAHYI